MCNKNFDFRPSPSIVPQIFSPGSHRKNKPHARNRGQGTHIRLRRIKKNKNNFAVESEENVRLRTGGEGNDEQKNTVR